MSDTENLDYVAEVLRKAALEAHDELLRRGVSAEETLGAVILTFISLGIQYSHEAHRKLNIRAASLLSIHQNIDKLWAACDEDDRKNKD